MVEKICYALIILAFIVIIFYVGVSMQAIEDIKKKLNAKEIRCIRTDNGCDVCCRDCDDKDVCIECCSHAICAVVAEQYEEGEKDYGTDEL